MKERDQLLANIRKLIGEIQWEKSAPVQLLLIRRAADLLSHAAAELEQPAWSDTDVPMAVALLLGAQSRFVPPLLNREWGVGVSKDHDAAINKLRELFKYTDPQ